MKIGIVGAGNVGSTAAYAMVMRGVGTEIVLIDQRQDLLIEQVDLPTVALEQLLIELLHQTTQLQIVGAVLMQILLDHVKQLLLTRSGHASLPL